MKTNQSSSPVTRRSSPDIMNCPGAWYGNQPSGDFGLGTIVVDIEKAQDALAWLKRRFFIVNTRAQDGGMGVWLQEKSKRPQGDWTAQMSMASE